LHACPPNSGSLEAPSPRGREGVAKIYYIPVFTRRKDQIIISLQRSVYENAGVTPRERGCAGDRRAFFLLSLGLLCGSCNGLGTMKPYQLGLMTRSPFMRKTGGNSLAFSTANEDLVPTRSRMYCPKGSKWILPDLIRSGEKSSSLITR
jgi:hypothetical protein